MPLKKPAFSEQEFAAQPTATALAMQEAERRGRRVPGQPQLEDPSYTPADRTIQELRNLEQRISTEGQAVRSPTEGQITEQGDLIGPKGGPRTRMPAAKTQADTCTSPSSNYCTCTSPQHRLNLQHQTEPASVRDLKPKSQNPIYRRWLL